MQQNNESGTIFQTQMFNIRSDFNFMEKQPIFAWLSKEGLRLFIIPGFLFRVAK